MPPLPPIFHYPKHFIFISDTINTIGLLNDKLIVHATHGQNNALTNVHYLFNQNRTYPSFGKLLWKQMQFFKLCFLGTLFTVHTFTYLLFWSVVQFLFCSLFFEKNRNKLKIWNKSLHCGKKIFENIWENNTIEFI